MQDASREAVQRTGSERVAFECSTEVGADRSDLSCYDALRATGDRARAAKELERVRALYAAPQAYLALSLRDATAAGDTEAAARAFEAMLPGEKNPLGALYGKAGRRRTGGARLAGARGSRRSRGAAPALPRFWRRPDGAVRAESPSASPPPIARRPSSRARPRRCSRTTSATRSRRSGLLHFVLFDVRRVSGTTDVEENAQAESAGRSPGRTTMRILRRRMFKKDGRVVEPERTPERLAGARGALAARAGRHRRGDLRRAGRARRAMGTSCSTRPNAPRAHGGPRRDNRASPAGRAHGVDSGRTRCSARRPSHATGDARVLSWTMKDASERRIEEGTPKMDRGVAVSFSTAKWADSARALRETLASLDEHDPEVARVGARRREAGRRSRARSWTRSSRAAGKSVKEGQARRLSDVEVGRPDGAQQTTARTILVEPRGQPHVAHRARAARARHRRGRRGRRERARSAPTRRFPPHAGRFMHSARHRARQRRDDGATDRTCGSTRTSPALPLPRDASRRSSAGGPRSTRRTVEPLPSVAADAQASATRWTCARRSTRAGTRRGRSRSFSAGAPPRSCPRRSTDRRRRAAAHAARRGARRGCRSPNVEKSVLSSTEESWQIALRATLTVPGYAQAEGAKLSGRTWILPGIDRFHAVYPRPAVATLGSTFASQGGRKDALAVNRAIQYHVHRRVELPAGATVARAPGGFEVKRQRARGAAPDQSLPQRGGGRLHALRDDRHRGGGRLRGIRRGRAHHRRRVPGEYPGKAGPLEPMRFG